MIGKQGQRADNGSRLPFGRRGFIAGSAAGVIGLGATKLALETDRDDSSETASDLDWDVDGTEDDEAVRRRQERYLEDLIPLLHLDADDDPISGSPRST